MGSWKSAAQDPRAPTAWAPANAEPHPVKRGPIPGMCYVCRYELPVGILGIGEPNPVHLKTGAECELCRQPVLEGEYRTTHPACSVKLKAAIRPLPAVDEPTGPASAETKRKPTGENTPRPDHPRYAEVSKYLRAYEGSNPFLSDMQGIVLGRSKWDRLTDRQVEGVCKFIDSERDRPAESGVDLTAFPVGRTYAAVDNDSGGVTFLIVDRPNPSHVKWGGWVFVKQQQGPTEVRLGSQRPRMTYTGQWPSLVARVLEDIPAAVRKYGMELGVCGVCGKALTNDESRAEGIGPVCAGRLAGEEAAA